MIEKSKGLVPNVDCSSSAARISKVVMESSNYLDAQQKTTID